MGVNDDWSYARSAEIYASSGRFVYMGYANAMLGWHVLQGALFIKLFGFSYSVVRASTTVVAALTALLMYATGRRIGLNRLNASAITLTFTLSPLYLPLSTSFMTDVGGIFCLSVCLYCCLRIIQAGDAAAACTWIVVGSVSNVALGTVRQIMWLGALVMIPTAVCLARRRRGTILVGSAMWLISALCIHQILGWFMRQPYSLPEHLLDRRPDLSAILRLAHYWALALLALPLFLCPVWAAFLPKTPLKKVGTRIVLVSTAALLCGVFLLSHHPASWLEPTLSDWMTRHGAIDTTELLGERPVILSTGVRIAISLFNWSSGLAFFCFLLFGERKSSDRNVPENTIVRLAFLLFPFCLIYTLTLSNRTMFYLLVDRYLLPLILVGLYFSALIYQRYVREHLPLITFVLIVALGAYSTASTHDAYSLYRARLAATNELEAAGIIRTQIRGGVEYDGMTQVMKWGYVDDQRILTPSNAVVAPNPPIDPQKPLDYLRIWFPAVEPRFVLSYQKAEPSVRASGFPPIAYKTWLPPYQHAIYILEY